MIVGQLIDLRRYDIMILPAPYPVTCTVLQANEKAYSTCLMLLPSPLQVRCESFVRR